jgi:DNA-binding PadR family transcriptional regulator
MQQIIKGLTGRASPTVGTYSTTKERTHGSVEKFPPQRELFILWALRKSGRRGVYGLDIQRAIQECSGGTESVSHGSLYSLLKRLRDKEYISSYEGDALGGGAKRHYYYLTEKGAGVINTVDVLLDRLKNWHPE